MPTDRDQANTRDPSAIGPVAMMLAGGLETTATSPSDFDAHHTRDASTLPMAPSLFVTVPAGPADHPAKVTSPAKSVHSNPADIASSTNVLSDTAVAGIARLVGGDAEMLALLARRTDVIRPTVRGAAESSVPAGHLATDGSPAAPSVVSGERDAAVGDYRDTTTFLNPNAPLAVPYRVSDLEAPAATTVGSRDIHALTSSAVGAGTMAVAAGSTSRRSAGSDNGRPVAPAGAPVPSPSAITDVIAAPTAYASNSTAVGPDQASPAPESGPGVDPASAAAPSLAATAAIALDLQPAGTTFGVGGDETTAMTLGNTGTGITVGILSDSFDTSGNADTTGTDIADGYLPRNTTVEVEGPARSTDEGRAMAQIVHEEAPGASILFATGDNTQQEFANNILTLANDGAKVIVDDLVYYAEPDYQDGVIAQAIEKVESEGVVYLTSAQNDAAQGYEGAFVPGLTFTYDGQTFTADDFSGSGTALSNALLSINTRYATTVNLEWESPAASAGGGGATSDLAIFVVNSAGTVIDTEQGYGIGDAAVLGGDPSQQVYLPVGERGDYLEVGLLSGSAAPADLKIVAFDDAGDVTLGAEASNIDDGSMSGHASAPGVIAVGAADYENTPAYGDAQPVNESFSSAGPDIVTYADDGQLLTTPRVATVAATGADGDITSFFGNHGTDEQGDSGYFFYGTSAAAPSLAGVAALMLQENSALTPADVNNLLQDSATLQPTVNDAGVANPEVGGAGLVDGSVAIQFSQLMNGGLNIDADGAVLGSHFDDRLTPDSGTATMTGFAGADTFVITASDAGYALAGGAPDTVTDYDQGDIGAYEEYEGDTLDLSGVYASYATAGEATDSFARVFTVLGSGVGQVQVMAGSGWTTVAILDGVRFQDPVSAAVLQAGADGVLQAVTMVATPVDLVTVTDDLGAAMVSDGRFVVEITTAGLSSNASFKLPGSVTLQTDVGTTTLDGALYEAPSNDAGSLVKAGPGTLVLGNDGSTFAAGTTITGGILELDAQAFGSGTNFTSGVVGKGNITFAPAAGSTATLRLDTQAQPAAGATFGNVLQGFGNDDVLDLAQYDYMPGVTEAIYDSQNDTLTVEELVATTGAPALVSDQEVFALEDPTPNGLGQFFVAADGDGGTIVDNGTACFLSGSRIATPDGEVAVETLCPGMSVSVLEAGAMVAQRVRWVGRGRSDGRDAAAPDRYPVRIRAGVPTRDLLVTGEHCILLDGGLVPARMLVNASSIVRDSAIAAFDFFHVELDRHGILLAEALEAESYLATGNRRTFRGGAVTMLRPDFGTDSGNAAWATDAAAPLTVAREAVEPIWRRLAMRAAAMGRAAPAAAMLEAEAALHLLTDAGVRLDPVFRDGTAPGFVVPRGTRTLRLVSRASRPSEVVGPFLDDRRRLGVLVGKVTVTGDRRRFGSAAHLSATALAGWHDPEGGGSCRWTDGDAVLALDALPTAGGAALITLEILAGGPYLAAPAPSEVAEAEQQSSAA